MSAEKINNNNNNNVETWALYNICPLVAHNSLSPTSNLIFSLSPHHCTAGISNDVYPMSSSVKTMDTTVFTFKRWALNVKHILWWISSDFRSEYCHYKWSSSCSDGMLCIVLLCFDVSSFQWMSIASGSLNSLTCLYFTYRVSYPW